MSTPFQLWLHRVSRWFAPRPQKRGRVATPSRPRRAYLGLEALEDRAVPATFYVNTVLDPSIGAGVNANGTIMGTHTISLRSAIDAANMNNSPTNLIKLVIAGTYKEMLPGANTTTDASGAFAILPNTFATTNLGYVLTIVNASGGNVFVNGNHLDRVFDINPAFNFTTPANQKFTVVLEGFQINNGMASSMANPDGADGSGGGIRDQGNASLTLIHMFIQHNSATADGGGVSMENTVSEPWKLIVENTLISDNHAGDAGGGIETDGHGVVSVTNSVITGNTCVNQGAGIWLDAIFNTTTTVFESARLTVTGSLVSNNTALVAMNGMLFNDGGGIGNAGDDFGDGMTGVTLMNDTIADNYSAGVGGGFGDQNNADTLNIQNSLFLGNSSGNDGGGIYFSGTTGTISHTEIKGNATGDTGLALATGGFGGGLFVGGPVTSSGTPTGTTATVINLMASTLAANTAAVGGGGIELETIANGSTITTTTITDNYAVNNAGATTGGGIDAPTTFTGSVTLLNDTINANIAANGGGIFWAGMGTSFTLQNTIVALNFVGLNGGTGPDIDSNSVALTNHGGNFIGNTSGETGITPVAMGDPRLGLLGYNGGPTVGGHGILLGLETEILLVGSQAIGTGVTAGAPTFDERGDIFVHMGKINIGAVSA